MLIHLNEEIRSVVTEETNVQTEVKALYKDQQETEFVSDSFFIFFRFQPYTLEAVKEQEKIEYEEQDEED